MEMIESVSVEEKVNDDDQYVKMDYNQLMKITEESSIVSSTKFDNARRTDPLLPVTQQQVCVCNNKFIALSRIFH